MRHPEEHRISRRDGRKFHAVAIAGRPAEPKGSGDGNYSSGMPALRRPAKEVASNMAATFGTPQSPGGPQVLPVALTRAMLE